MQDPSKAAIPQATVVVTDTATNQATTVLTSERGDFVVTPLNPGTYQVTVKMDGFQTAVVEAAEVQVGQSTRVDVELTLGALTESTIVTSAMPLLDTESGTLGHVVTNTQIVNLPLNGRSFYELARLTPGAVLLPGGGNLLRIRANYISGTAVSGVRGSQTTFMLDGVDVTDHHQGGSLDPDVGRRAAGVQGAAERLLGGVQPGGRRAERHDQVGIESVPRRAVRVHARRSLRRAQLLRARDGRTEAASVRRDDRRSAAAQPHVLLREL